MNGRLRKQLKRHEGLRLKPYRDTVGKLTIGIGRNLDDRGITEDEAELLLDTDLSIVERELEPLVWFRMLNPPRKDVIRNMTFNMGLPTLLRFRNMIAALERDDYDTAAAEMLDSRWARQVKGRADELAEQMRSGRYD